MEMETLPPYRGLIDSPKQWGEANERGKRPGWRRRDLVVLVLIVMFFGPFPRPALMRLWRASRTAEHANATRDKELLPQN